MQPANPRAIPGFHVQRRLGRISGLLYLLLAVSGMCSPLVLQTLVVRGDAATTAANILGSLGLFSTSLVIWIVIVAADVAVSITLYPLLEPVSRPLSLVAAAFRLVYSAVLAGVLLNLYQAYLLLASPAHAAALGIQQGQAMALLSIDAFSAGFLLALVIFGVHLVMLGALLYRSHYVPPILGMLSSPRALATHWTAWPACSRPTTAVWREWSRSRRRW
jgi:hypothetical protein